MAGLYLAPMEEITGYAFRNTLNRHFGSVDKYFTPFISPDNRIMKTRCRREIIPSNNEGLNVVPQLLTNDAAQFNEAAALFADFGYEEININFGCPSNTVAGKFKGSGILRAPDQMDRLLDGIFNGTDSVLRSNPAMKISVKTRVGYNDTSDFEKVIDVLKRYPVCEITVHPRLKKDLYKGTIRMEMFDMALECLNADIVYNGDINTVADYEAVSARSDAGDRAVKAVMIGRGAVRNPGIFRQIRKGCGTTKRELNDFLCDLYETYNADCGEVNAICKMKEVWSYTTSLIEDDSERSDILKTIIKSKSAHAYKDATLLALSKLPDIIE